MITIETLRKAGLSDAEIIRVLEAEQAAEQAKRAEKRAAWAAATARHRARKAAERDAEKVVPIRPDTIV